MNDYEEKIDLHRYSCHPTSRHETQGQGQNCAVSQTSFLARLCFPGILLLLSLVLIEPVLMSRLLLMYMVVIEPALIMHLDPDDNSDTGHEQLNSGQQEA